MGSRENQLTGFKDGRFYQNGLTGVVGFVAPPGHGKNYLMAYVFSWARRVVVFNTVGTYANGGENKNPLPGFTFVYRITDLIAMLRAAGADGDLRVCFTPIEVDLLQQKRGKFMELFHDCCALVMRYKKVVFAIDEVHYFHPGVAPLQLPEIQRVMFTAWRHFEITPMWASQMPQLVNSAVRSVTTEMYVGNFTDDLDVDAVRRCKVKDSQAIALLPRLAPFQFIHQYENGQWRVEQAPRR